MIYRSLSFDIALHWFEQNKLLITRIFALAAVLLASAYLAPRIAMGNRAPTYLLLLFLGVGAAVIFLKWPALGLVALIPISLYVPFNLGTGTEVALPAPMFLVSFLAGLWLLDMLVRQKRINILHSRPVTALIVFVLVAVLAFAVGLLPLVPLAPQQASIFSQIGGLAVFVLSALTFLLAAHQVPDLRWLQVVTWIFLALGAAYIAGRLIPTLGTTRIFQHGAHGSLFWIWLVALAFSQAIMNKDLKPFWRLALLGLVLATLFYRLFPRSRLGFGLGAWLGSRHGHRLPALLAPGIGTHPAWCGF
jgi:hypothetical protein